jgi:hypothetical protein
MPGLNYEDNIVKYWSVNAVWSLLSLFLLCACSSQIPLEDLSRQWLARPLSELKEEMKSPNSYDSKIGWKETTYPLANGNFVYIEPISADCSVHWEINESGLIVGIKSRGSYCKEREESNSGSLNTPPRSK